MTTNTNLLGINEITDILGIGRNSAYKLVNSGEIPSYQFGRKRLIRQEDLNDYINKKFDLQKKK